jgi:hypothetical protein
MADDVQKVEQALVDAAVNPASMTIDGNYVLMPSIGQLLQLMQYFGAKQALQQQGSLGIVIKRLSPPGTV